MHCNHSWLPAILLCLIGTRCNMVLSSLYTECVCSLWLVPDPTWCSVLCTLSVCAVCVWYQIQHGAQFSVHRVCVQSVFGTRSNMVLSSLYTECVCSLCLVPDPTWCSVLCTPSVCAVCVWYQIQHGAQFSVHRVCVQSGHREISPWGGVVQWANVPIHTTMTQVYMACWDVCLTP